MVNPPAPQCPKGHPYTPSNLLVSASDDHTVFLGTSQLIKMKVVAIFCKQCGHVFGTVRVDPQREAMNRPAPAGAAAQS